MMKLLFKTILLFVITVLFFQSTGLIYAGESEQLGLPKTSVNPGSFYYNFKRLFEKGQEKLIFSKSSKETFYSSQLKVRLAELNYVVENKVLSEIESSSKRFAYQAGVLTDFVVAENKDKEKTAKEFEQMQKLLEKLRDKYPANSSFWMLIQHDINTLSILSEKLK